MPCAWGGCRLPLNGGRRTEAARRPCCCRDARTRECEDPAPNACTPTKCAKDQSCLPGGRCCKKESVCGNDPYKQCCTSDETCILGQCVVKEYVCGKGANASYCVPGG